MLKLLALALLAGIVQTCYAQDSASPYDTNVWIHGGVLFAGLGVMLPLAILFPAALRNVTPSGWMPVHAFIQLIIVLPLTGIGFYYSKKVSFYFGFDYMTRHQKLGLAVFILVVLQMALGIVQNIVYRSRMARYNKTEKVTAAPKNTILHLFHHVIGYLLVLLILIQIPFGLQEYGPGSTPNGVWIAWWIWTGIILASLIAAVANDVRKSMANGI